MNLNQKPLISICIPVFNGSNFIGDCIESILSQNFENFEVIVVDNASSDNTLEIVRSYKDPRMNVISNEKNIGALNNFSKCIDVATCEYFVMIPHDDIMHQDFLKNMSDILVKDKNIGFVFAGVDYIDENKDIIKKLTHPKSLHYDCDVQFTKHETIYDIITNFMPIQLPMVRTKILKDIGGFDENFSLFADVNLWLRIMYLDWDVYFKSKVLSSLRTHSMQAQRGFQTQDTKILSEHYGLELKEDFWKKNNYNYLFLKLINFILEESTKKNYSLYFVEKEFLPVICRLNLKALFFSLIKLSIFKFKNEFINLNKIYFLFGLKKVLFTFFFVIINEIRHLHKLIPKLLKLRSN
tara:strand:+ start:530 stop:1588 length:1059 start_codon:yes stop_codon:yes gene_type:complete